MIQIKNRRDIITAIYGNLERLVNCKLIADSEKIRNDIHTLVHVFYMAVEPAEEGRGENAELYRKGRCDEWQRKENG